jgi:hypothetical protein
MVNLPEDINKKYQGSELDINNNDNYFTSLVSKVSSDIKTLIESNYQQDN